MKKPHRWLLAALLITLPLGMLGGKHETARNVNTLGGLQGVQIDRPVPTHPTVVTAVPTTTTAAPPTTEPPRTTTTKASRGVQRTAASTTTTEHVHPTTSVPPTTAAPTPHHESSQGWSTATASWYGPGLYGNSTACGQRYTDQIAGVAHKTLKCGTMVTFSHEGRTVTVPVIDRGPYVGGRMWDLSARTCRDLGHCYTGQIKYRIG